MSEARVDCDAALVRSSPHVDADGELSVADEVNANLSGSNAGNIRFALNNVSTSGIVSDTSLAPQAVVGSWMFALGWPTP